LTIFTLVKVLNFAKGTVYTIKLQRSYTTCVKPNTIAEGYKHSCFKLPENGNAGNKMQMQEVTNRYVYNKMQLQEVANTFVLNFRRIRRSSLIQSKKITD